MYPNKIQTTIFCVGTKRNKNLATTIYCITAYVRHKFLVNDKVTVDDSGSGSGSGIYSGGLTWSIVLRCDVHTGIFTCDGCARDQYFYVPAETQSYVIKLALMKIKRSSSYFTGIKN